MLNKFCKRVDGMNVCEALETAWRDLYNRSEIKDFISAWLKKKAEKKQKSVVGVIQLTLKNQPRTLFCVSSSKIGLMIFLIIRCVNLFMLFMVSSSNC